MGVVGLLAPQLHWLTKITGIVIITASKFWMHQFWQKWMAQIKYVKMAKAPVLGIKFSVMPRGGWGENSNDADKGNDRLASRCDEEFLINVMTKAIHFGIKTITHMHRSDLVTTTTHTISDSLG